MPIPRSVRRAMRGWRPEELSVLTGNYERTQNFSRVCACVSRLVRRVSRTLQALSCGQRVDLSAASADVLELVGLSEKKGSLIGALSRGMQQRLGLARVLIHDPQLLLQLWGSALEGSGDFARAAQCYAGKAPE